MLEKRWNEQRPAESNKCTSKTKEHFFFFLGGRICEIAHCVQCRMHNKFNDGKRETKKRKLKRFRKANEMTIPSIR